MLLCSPAYPNPYCWNLVALGPRTCDSIIAACLPTVQGRCCELCLISKVLTLYPIFLSRFCPQNCETKSCLGTRLVLIFTDQVKFTNHLGRNAVPGIPYYHSLQFVPLLRGQTARKIIAYCNTYLTIL